MRYISVFAVLSVLLLAVFPAYADDDDDDDAEEERNEVVGLFGTLSTPSIFVPASPENLCVMLYVRTITGEGNVPDFDGDVRDEVDSLQIFAAGRLGGLGLTLGFGQGNEFEFSQPIILSVDYKVGLMEEAHLINAAVDAQYTLIALPDEENIRLSALGFGVFSLNGLIGAKLPFVEPYAGLSLNYVYLNSEDEFIGVIRAIPKLGAYVRFLMVTVATEIQFLKNEYLDSAWMWNIGAGIRF